MQVPTGHRSGGRPRAAAVMERRMEHKQVRVLRGRRRRIALVAAAAVAVVGVQATVQGLTGGAQAAGIKNSSFEDGVASWTVTPSGTSTVQRVSGGHAGSWSALVTNKASSAKTTVLNDSPNSVTDTDAGDQYTVSAWVRTDRPGITVDLRALEWKKGSGTLGQKEKYVYLTDTAWHKLAVTYTATVSGAQIDVNVLAWQLPAGQSFYVDDVAMSAVTKSGEPIVTSTTSASATTTTSATASATTSTTTSKATSSTTTSTSKTAATSSSSSSTTTSASTGVPATVNGMSLVWNDEFNDSTIDTSKWNVLDDSTYGDGNNELACLTNRSDNVRESGGNLIIQAQKESTKYVCGSSDSRFPNGRSYTSAMLTTQGKGEWTYGRFEMRAIAPTQEGTSKGLWPAFWMRPAAGGTGELDILEAIGSGSGDDEYNKVHQTIWYDYDGTYPKQANIASMGSSEPSDGYHVYAVEWDEDSITWYVDGKATYTRTGSTTSWLESTFNKDMFIRLNLAVGGNWPGSPDSDTDFTQAYKIDYVRVYQ